MRFGGPVFEKNPTPDAWVAALKKLGYSAAYCPVNHDATDDTVRAFENAAKAGDIVIAETGAWSNPMSPDEQKRKEALKLCRDRLALAERIGARCCVNITGSRGEQWDGPHPDNLTPETFDMIVEVTRGIIDDVKPTRSFYTLETMPWMYPDSTESYAKLMKAIDRRQFAVHFDPVNLICSPQRFYTNAKVIKDFVKKLGPYIKSCHGKDIALSGKLTTHLDEARPGLGKLDYGVYLKELAKLEPDVCLMLEHLPTPEEYLAAGEYVRSVAKAKKVAIR